MTVIKMPGARGGGSDGEWQEADDDVIQGFQLENSGLRGRAVRLGPVLDEILGPHAYPDAVAQLTAETMALACLLSSMLKYEGIFTLQAKGDGPVSMLVADMTSKAELRGCATFDADKLAKASEVTNPAQLLGNGYLVFTVDPGAAADRYQGIVELKGETLADSVRHYFAQSEQIGAGISIAAAKHADGSWRAGAIMLQRMPEERKKSTAEWDEDWNRSMVLLASCTDAEFLDPRLHSNALLYRLFHEEGVRVFAPAAITKGCRCDKKKVEKLLKMMPADDIEYMAQDGRIVARCEFCSKDFAVDLEKVKKDKKPGGKKGKRKKK